MFVLYQSILQEMPESFQPPLRGQRVLLTRPAEQAGTWAQVLARAGARPIVYPTIAVVPPPSWDELDAALAELHRYAWILFTGASAVRHTLSRLPEPGRLVEGGRQVAAVGAETARALESAGVPVAVVPDEKTGRGLAQALAHVPYGTRFLFPQAMGGRVELQDALLARGCMVDVVPASQTVAIRPLPALPEFDVALFASPSALRAFLAEHSSASLRDRAVLAIGPTTAAVAQALGIEPHVAPAPDIESVVAALATLPARGARPSHRERQ